jgi:hypothetical protein
VELPPRAADDAAPVHAAGRRRRVVLAVAGLGGGGGLSMGLTSSWATGDCCCGGAETGGGGGMSSAAGQADSRLTAPAAASNKHTIDRAAGRQGFRRFDEARSLLSCSSRAEPSQQPFNRQENAPAVASCNFGTLSPAPLPLSVAHSRCPDPQLVSSSSALAPRHRSNGGMAEEQWHLRPANPSNPVVFFGEQAWPSSALGGPSC